VLLSSTLFAGNEKNYTYLALGDSVAFGLDVRLLVNQPLPLPSAFTGYPETVAQSFQPLSAKQHVNAACPGETAASFRTAGAPDLGCHDRGPQGQPPFKTWIGLHTDYPGTQLEFAVSQLSANKHIQLVTLGIGSNDVLLLVRACQAAADPMACVVAGLPGMLQTFAGNLAQILGAIRATGYSGKLVLVLFYAPVADLIPVAAALNGATMQVGGSFDVTIADGFTAFQTAAAPFGGDVCKAGLLIPLGPSTCDIHPSPKGRDLLAATVLAAIGDQLK
jgi:lysophospholipase L1-like esterase